MPKLLKIDVSPRGGHSVSRKLSAEFAERWLQAHPGGTVAERDLAQTDLPFVELPWISAAYTDPTGHSDEEKKALRVGNELIAELQAADEWVLSTPMYNFAAPARLKAYVDHIVRAGITFKVNADGTFAGLLGDKNATVIIASASEYSAGTPAEAFDKETPYLKFILGFIGVTDVTFVHAGSTWKLDRGMVKPEEFFPPHTEAVLAAAAK